MNPRTIVEVVQLTVHFDSFDLGPLSFTVPLGSRVALVGRNGSGKSTLLRALSGRLPEVGGSARVWDHDVRQHRAGLRRIVGFSDHRPPGFTWMSVAEHLRFMAALHPGWDPDRAARICEEFELPSATPIQELSRGMQARLALAGVEACQPRVLMLDEPTATLDPDTRRRVIDRLDASCPLGGGRVLVFSTHHAEEILRLADRVIVLERGRITRDVPLPKARQRCHSQLQERERSVRQVIESVAPVATDA